MCQRVSHNETGDKSVDDKKTRRLFYIALAWVLAGISLEFPLWSEWSEHTVDIYGWDRHAGDVISGHMENL